MKIMCFLFLLLMNFMSSIFAADNSSNLSQSFASGFDIGQRVGGRYTGLQAGLNEISEKYQQQQQAQADAQAIAQQMQQQQQLNQGSSQGQVKIFSSIVYLDAATAQNAYNDFVAGRQNFNGQMFTLNQITDQFYYALYDSLQVRQLTTVLRGTDGKFYVVVRLQ